jgi:hypothetical protein
MRFMKYFLSGLLIIGISHLYGQSVFVPLNKDYYQLLDRYEIRNGSFSNTFHTSVRPIERKAVVEFIDSLHIDSSKLSRSDRFNFSYLQNDNWEWSSHADNNSKRPIFKRIYRNKSDFFHFQNEDLDLHISPVIYFQGGHETNSSIDKTVNTTINTRGLELRGMINKKVGFYSFMTDNQALFSTYVRNYIDTNNAVPGEGFHKEFKTNGADFLTARGYITFNLVKCIHVQFGHDKVFVGNGYRSLVLSDFSSNYTFLKLNTKVWKFNYMNLFAQMNAKQTGADTYYPQKYFALHHLSINLTKHINIGVFESVVFGNRDSTRRGQFDANYLNPIIFYRSLEQHLGSADNALLGMDYKINFLRHFSLYGQVVLDEFYFQDLKAANGSYRNKYAVQTGLKYIDAAGIRNLDLQVEANVVRPYTYQHFSSYTSYTNYNQALAHPLGSNFYEFIGIARYQPTGRLNMVAKLFYSRFGADTSVASRTNYGGDLGKAYNIGRPHSFGNKVAQGITSTLIFMNLTLTYQVRHNLFLDVSETIRKVTSDMPSRNMNNSITSVALRWNIPQRLQEF